MKRSCAERVSYLRINSAEEQPSYDLKNNEINHAGISVCELDWAT
jgi:hypothetical protein